jgi:hypothetical protein
MIGEAVHLVDSYAEALEASVPALTEPEAMEQHLRSALALPNIGLHTA